MYRERRCFCDAKHILCLCCLGVIFRNGYLSAIKLLKQYSSPLLLLLLPVLPCKPGHYPSVISPFHLQMTDTIETGTHALQVALCPPRIEPVISLSVVKHNRRRFITIMTIVTAEDHFLWTLSLLWGHCDESLETTWHLWWITETNTVYGLYCMYSVSSVVMHFEQKGWKQCRFSLLYICLCHSAQKGLQ